MNPFKTVIKQRGENIYDILMGANPEKKPTIQRAVEATSEAFGTPAALVHAALPTPVKRQLAKIPPVISRGFDKITDNKTLQRAALAIPEKAMKPLNSTLGTLAPLGNIAGNILAVNAGAKLAQATTDRVAAMTRGIPNKQGGFTVFPATPATSPAVSTPEMAKSVVNKWYTTMKNYTADAAKDGVNTPASKIIKSIYDNALAQVQRDAPQYAKIFEGIDITKITTPEQLQQLLISAIK